MVVQRSVDGGIFVFFRQVRRVEQGRKVVFLLLRDLLRRLVLHLDGRLAGRGNL